MSTILTNGVTTLLFRNSDFVLATVPPKRKPQIILPSSAGLSRVHTVSNARSRVLQAEVILTGADQGVNAGADSLVAFFENSDNTGVDGLEKTFMLTDPDGVTYQVRFVDNLAGGLTEVQKGSIFRGSFRLMEELTLPTEESTLTAWWAAYDMDNNGGDLTAWTTTDPVGGAGATDWDDKSANGYDATEATNQALWETGLINGRPAVHFDGTNDKLSADALTAFNGTTDAAFSVYGVIQADVVSSTDVVAGVGHATNTDQLDLIRRNAATDWETYIYDGAAGATEVGGTPDTSAHIFAVISTGTNGLLYLDGSLIATTGDLNVGQVDVDSFTIGAVEIAGTYSNFWDGKIGELVVFQGVEHTTLQRRRQEYRLSDMWGIALTQ